MSRLRSTELLENLRKNYLATESAPVIPNLTPMVTAADPGGPNDSPGPATGDEIVTMEIAEVAIAPNAPIGNPVAMNSVSGGPFTPGRRAGVTVLANNLVAPTGAPAPAPATNPPAPEGIAKSSPLSSDAMALIRGYA